MVALIPFAPRIVEAVELSLPLRMSVLVAEALNRAAEDVDVANRLGVPLEVGWSVEGYIRRSNGGWHEAALSIPISGPRGPAGAVAEALQPARRQGIDSGGTRGYQRNLCRIRNGYRRGPCPYSCPAGLRWVGMEAGPGGHHAVRAHEGPAETRDRDDGPA